jgi:hypothetical protein
MLLRSRAALVCLAAVLALTAGCEEPAKPDLTPVTLGWQEVTLPIPPGDPGRLALRDVVVCDGTWFAVGAVIGEAVDNSSANVAAEVVGAPSRPAAWTSTDGRRWRALATAPISYYGKLNVLFSAACAGGRFAAIGAKSGGSHGNPRTSTWFLRDDTMVEVNAEFTLYGGSEAVNVSRMSAGAKGFLIAGNRVSGAAAWLSPDATAFNLIEAAPNLASDPQVDTFAQDGMVTETGYTLIGGGLTKGRIDRDPLVWLSADGTAWRRVVLPRDDTFEELQRMVRVGDDLVAVGLHGETFGAWRGKGETWEAAGRFGAGMGRTGLGGVRSATSVKGALLVAAQDGERYAMWLSSDAGRAWRPASLPPGDHPAGAERTIGVAASGDTVIAVTDNARQGHVWLGHYSA